MKNLFVILVAAVSILSSCKKDDKEVTPEVVATFKTLTGKYEGTFTYTTPDNKRTDPVILEITDSLYYSPSISKDTHMGGNGFYFIEKQSIHFENDTFNHADFDWGLTLSGTYKYQFNGRELKLERIDIEGSNKYEYLFIKK